MTQGRQSTEDGSRGILIVSFGTSFPETRAKTLDQIEQSFRGQYPGWQICHAWSSARLRRKLHRRDGIEIPDVGEGLEELCRRGVTKVAVQPTYVLNGIEYQQMMADLEQYRDRFECLVSGTPLLTSQEDCDRMVRLMGEEILLEPGEALVWMGHGTVHCSNFVYAALAYQLRERGYRNVFVGTAESYPSFDTVLREIQSFQPSRVVLSPFLIVVGEHARSDLAGDGSGSWKSRLEQAGFSVRCVLKGLGEYEAVRELLLEHGKAAAARLEEGRPAASGNE